MNSRMLIIGALTLALIAAAGLLLLQQSKTRAMAAEIADLRSALDRMASLQDINRQLAGELKAATEASQADQSELMRRRGQSSRLRQLEQENAQLQAQRHDLNRRLSAAQAAAAPAPDQRQATRVATNPEADTTDLGMVELMDAVPTRFDLGGGTNCVVRPRALSDGNITMEIKTEVIGPDGTASKLAMSQLTARPGQSCSISVGDRMIAIGAKLK